MNQKLFKTVTMLSCMIVSSVAFPPYNETSAATLKTSYKNSSINTASYSDDLIPQETLDKIAADIERQRSENEAIRKSHLETKVIQQPAQTKKQAPVHYKTTAAEKSLILHTMANESIGEPFQGQQAIAQCILDTCVATNERPTSVLVPGQYAVEGTAEITDSVRNAFVSVFEKGEKVTEEDIRWFYAPARCHSDWHEAQKFIFELGGHRFFAPKET